MSGVAHTTHTPPIWVVIPAAGVGARIGAATPKQYLPLAGRPILLHTLERLATVPAVTGVFIGVSVDDGYWQALEPEFRAHEKFQAVYPGGAERAATVLNGLQQIQAVAAAGDWVMVHDAARPCVRRSDIEALIAQATRHADGAILGLAMADTVKLVDDRQQIIETVERTGLWRAQTPQLFPLERLQAALQRVLSAGVQVTDESAAMELVGAHPLLVPGHADNIKITLPGDLALAELYLQRQTQEA